VGYVPVEEYAFFVIQPIMTCLILFYAQRRSGWRGGCGGGTAAARAASGERAAVMMADHEENRTQQWLRLPYTSIHFRLILIMRRTEAVAEITLHFYAFHTD
jgi:hypothetical protein